MEILPSLVNKTLATKLAYPVSGRSKATMDPKARATIGGTIVSGMVYFELVTMKIMNTTNPVPNASIAYA